MFYLKTLEKEEHTKPKVGSFPSSEPLQFPHQQLLSPRDVAFQEFTLFPKGCFLGWPLMDPLQVHPYLLLTSFSQFSILFTTTPPQAGTLSFYDLPP